MMMFQITARAVRATVHIRAQALPEASRPALPRPPDEASCQKMLDNTVVSGVCLPRFETVRNRSQESARRERKHPRQKKEEP